jgi:quercetin dioxygenase-like cupin family protein
VTAGHFEKPRRFVTGQRGERSRFARVEEVEEIDYQSVYGTAIERPGGVAVYRMWAWDALPTLPNGGETPLINEQPHADGAAEALRRSSVHPVGVGGLRVNLAVFPPGHRGAMHWHDTVDLQWLISGQLLLSLDDGSDVTMRPGDLVIQHGTNHRWETPASVGAVLAVILSGAARVGTTPPTDAKMIPSERA